MTLATTSPMELRAAVALLVFSCGGYADAPTHVETRDEWHTRTLLDTAAHDLACPVSSLTGSDSDLAVLVRGQRWGTARLDMVEGCGLRATYTLKCTWTTDAHGDDHESCRHVILSRVEIPH